MSVAPKIGEECLIDALILSRCNILVHGNSNVSNFILCYNKKIKNIEVYLEAHKEKGINLKQIF